MKEKRIKLSLAEASNWVAEGFDVECYAIVTPAQREKKPSRGYMKRNPRTTDDTVIGLSVEGTPPRQGAAKPQWAKLKKTLWGQDATATYTRKRITDEVAKLGAGTPTAVVSQFLWQNKVLRVVSDE